MISRSCNTRRCAGFSLLEVVVAFAILALALGVLWQIFSGAARRATMVQEYHRAVMLADSKMVELAAADILRPGTEGGEFDAHYRWQRRVEPYIAGDGSPRSTASHVPYAVTVEVRWGQRSIALTTVRLGRGE